MVPSTLYPRSTYCSTGAHLFVRRVNMSLNCAQVFLVKRSPYPDDFFSWYRSGELFLRMSKSSKCPVMQPGALLQKAMMGLRGQIDIVWNLAKPTSNMLATSKESVETLEFTWDWFEDWISSAKILGSIKLSGACRIGSDGPGILRHLIDSADSEKMVRDVASVFIGCPQHRQRLQLPQSGSHVVILWAFTPDNRGGDQ